MCSAPVGPDFATNGEQIATKPFAVYGERAQLLKQWVFEMDYHFLYALFICVSGTVLRITY